MLSRVKAGKGDRESTGHLLPEGAFLRMSGASFCMAADHLLASQAVQLGPYLPFAGLGRLQFSGSPPVQPFSRAAHGSPRS